MNLCLVASAALAIFLISGCSDDNGSEPSTDLGLEGVGTLAMSGNDTATFGTSITVRDMAYYDAGDDRMILSFVDPYSHFEGDVLSDGDWNDYESLYPEERFLLAVWNAVPGVSEGGAYLEIVRSGTGGAYITLGEGDPGPVPGIDVEGHVVSFENVTLYPSFEGQQDLSPITLNGTIAWEQDLDLE